MRNIDIYSTKRIFSTDSVVFEGYDLNICECSEMSCIANMHGKIWAIISPRNPDDRDFEIVDKLRSIAPGAGLHFTMLVPDGDMALQERALSVGVDDFLTTSVRQIDLLEHILTLRKQGIEIGYERVIAIKGFELDFRSYRLSQGGASASVTTREFKALRHFLTHPDTVITYTDLARVLGSDEEMAPSAIKRFISRMRSEITSQGVADPLRTIRSIGYAFDSF